MIRKLELREIRERWEEFRGYAKKANLWGENFEFCLSEYLLYVRQDKAHIWICSDKKQEMFFVMTMLETKPISRETILRWVCVSAIQEQASKIDLKTLWKDAFNKIVRFAQMHKASAIKYDSNGNRWFRMIDSFGYKQKTTKTVLIDG